MEYQFITVGDTISVGNGSTPWEAFHDALGPIANEVILDSKAPSWVNDDTYGYSARVFLKSGEYFGMFLKG